jgi:hypothetical protein
MPCWVGTGRGSEATVVSRRIPAPLSPRGLLPLLRLPAIHRRRLWRVPPHGLVVCGLGEEWLWLRLGACRRRGRQKLLVVCPGLQQVVVGSSGVRGEHTRRRVVACEVGRGAGVAHGRGQQVLRADRRPCVRDACEVERLAV